MAKNIQNNRFKLILVLILLALIATTGCADKSTPLEPASSPDQAVNDAATTPVTPAPTLPPAPDSHGSLPSPVIKSNRGELIPTECVEEQSRDYVISTDGSTQTHFVVEEERLTLPLRICRNSYDTRSDYNWLFSIQLHAVTAADGGPLERPPTMFLRYRQNPDDDNPTIHGDDGAMYIFNYNDRTNKYHALAAGDRGIYELVFEFEDAGGAGGAPPTIAFTITVQTWYV